VAIILALPHPQVAEKRQPEFDGFGRRLELERLLHDNNIPAANQGFEPRIFRLARMLIERTCMRPIQCWLKLFAAALDDLRRAAGTYIRPRFLHAGDIAGHFARAGSITEALTRSGVADYSRASTTVEARHADEAGTRELRLSPGAIVLFTRVLNVDPDGAPIQYSLTRFAADRMTLLIQPSRLAGAGDPDSKKG
jgi:hypothetical protein